MAAVELTISGVLYDKLARTTRPVVLIGEASLTGLGVGGGPIIPPEQPPKPDDPVHIWGGGNVPMPNPPIANVPGAPGYQPPVIVIPAPPPGPPQDPTQVVPPAPQSLGWAWVPDYGWGYFPAYSNRPTR